MCYINYIAPFGAITMPNNPSNSNRSPWQGDPSKFDAEDTAMRVMATVEHATKHPESVKSLGSFAEFAKDEPDNKPKPNDDPQNKGGFKP
jgi:hypothetical protein